MANQMPPPSPDRDPESTQVLRSIQARRFHSAAKLLLFVATVIGSSVPVGEIQAADGSTPKAEFERNGPKVSAAGVVVDENGAPLSGVKVFLREWSSNLRNRDLYNRHPVDVFASRETDEQGRFHFDNVASLGMRFDRKTTDRWDVVIAADGYAIAWQHLPDADNPQPLTLQLAPEFSLSGRVVDEQQQPIVGAAIEVYRVSSLDDPKRFGTSTDPLHLDLAQSMLSPRATTDSEGRFVIRGLPNNRRFAVFITHDDYQKDFAFAATADTDQQDLEGYPHRSEDGSITRPKHKVHTGDFTVTLKPGQCIQGQVLFDDTGKPCPRAKVSLTWNNRWNYSIADDQGRFEFPGLPDAEYKVSGVPNDEATYVSGSTEFAIDEAHPPAEVVVRLPRGQIVSGAVLAEDTRKGISGVNVVFETEPGQNRALDTTNERGAFRLVVAPGSGTVTISGPVQDYFIPDTSLLRKMITTSKPEVMARFRQDIEVSAEQPLETVRFSVDRGMVIRGVVKNPAGQPVAGAEVTRPRRFGGSREELATQTDDRGEFTFSGLPPDTEQHLEAVHSQRRLVAMAMVKPENPEQREVDCEIELQPAATITGRAELDGKPLADAKVQLHMHDTDNGRQIGRPVTDVFTDKDGNYTFALVNPGREYYVHVNRTESDMQTTRTVTAKAGETHELATAQFAALDMAVSGIVVDPDGNPVEGVVVSARDRRTGRQLNVQFRRRQESMTTDKQGRFKLEFLPNSPLQLMAYIKPVPGERQIRFPAYVDAEPGETDVQIIIDPKLVRRR